MSGYFTWFQRKEALLSYFHFIPNASFWANILTLLRGGNVWRRRSEAIQPMEELLSLYWYIIICLHVYIFFFCSTALHLKPHVASNEFVFKDLHTGCFSASKSWQLFSLNVSDWITMSTLLPHQHSYQLCISFLSLHMIMCFICTKTFGLVGAHFLSALSKLACIALSASQRLFSLTVVLLLPISCLPLTLASWGIRHPKLKLCEFRLLAERCWAALVTGYTLYSRIQCF